MAESIAELIDKNTEQAESLCALLTPCQEHVAELKLLLERALAQTDEVNQALAESRELLAALAGLKEKVEAARDSTSAAADTWEECLETATQNLTGAFDSTDTALGDLIELSGTIQTAWGQRQSEVLEALDGVATGVDALAQQVDSDRDSSHGTIAGLKTSVECSASRFEELQSSLLAALEELQEAADNGAEELTGNLEDWAQSGADVYESLSETVTSAFTTSTNGLESGWQEGIVGKLGTATEGLLTQFSEGTEVVDEIGEQLDGKVGDVIDKIDEVLDLVEEIKPVLEEVEKLLG